MASSLWILELETGTSEFALESRYNTLCPGRGRRSSSCWERSGRRSSSWTWRWCLCRASLRRTYSGGSNCGGFEPGRRPNFSGVCEGHLETREFWVESMFWEVYVTTMSQHYHSIVHESMCNFNCLSRVVHLSNKTVWVFRKLKECMPSKCMKVLLLYSTAESKHHELSMCDMNVWHSTHE